MDARARVLWDASATVVFPAGPSEQGARGQLLGLSGCSMPPKPGYLPTTLLSCTSCSPNKPLLLSTAPLLGQVYFDCRKEQEEGVIFCFSRGDGCSYFCRWCHSPPMRTARQKDSEPQAWGEACGPGGSQGRLLSEAEASTLMGFTDTKLLLSKFPG